MTITNGYCTLAEYKQASDITSTANDTLHELAISAASRMIDRHCGRKFWQDGSVVAREYHADDRRTVFTDDISTTTGLIVKVDTADDATWATTLTITTHFLLAPLNAADQVPVRPFDEIRLTDDTTDFFPTGVRPGVQVTAKFGWPAVPDEVKLATILQAQMLGTAKNARGGILQLSVDGIGPTRMSRRLHPQAELLLEDFVLEPR